MYFLKQNVSAEGKAAFLRSEEIFTEGEAQAEKVKGRS